MDNTMMSDMEMFLVPLAIYAGRNNLELQYGNVQF